MAIRFTQSETPAEPQKQPKKAKVLPPDPKVAKPRGFAAMSPEKRKQAAAKGGGAIRSGLRGFAANPELARAAGAKGGKAVPKTKRAFVADKDLASRAGKISKPKTKKEIKDVGTVDNRGN